MRRAYAFALLLAGCFTPRQSYEPHSACPAECIRTDEFGVIPDPASPLNQSQVTVGTEYVVAGEANAKEMTAWMPMVGFRYSGEHLALHFDLNPVRYTSNGDPASPLLKDRKHTSLGNLRVGLGYRLIDAPLGKLYRRGIAYRAVLGVDLRDNENMESDEVGLGNRLGDLLPFDRVRFMSGQYFEQALELRYELVGCHAPFLHVTAGMIGRKDIARHTISIPASITVGAHVNPLQNTPWIPRITVFVGYGILGGHLPSIDAEHWDIAQRFSAGVQLDPIQSRDGWSPPIRVEYASIVGPTDGFTVSAYLVYPLDLGGFPDAKQ